MQVPGKTHEECYVKHFEGVAQPLMPPQRQPQKRRTPEPVSAEEVAEADNTAQAGPEIASGSEEDAELQDAGTALGFVGRLVDCLEGRTFFA